MSAWVERVDANHANAKRHWQALGAPEYFDAKVVERLHQASRVKQQPCRWTWRERQAQIEIELPHHAVAALTVKLGSA